MSDFENGIISEPQRKQWPWCSLWVLSVGSCYLLKYIYIYIYIWQAINKYFIHLLWDLFFSHFVKKPQQLPKFLSLKFRKGKTSQKLRAVKENVSVKNTGTKILLQFSAENPKSGSGGRSKAAEREPSGGKKKKILKALQSLILLLLPLLWGLSQGCSLMHFLSSCSQYLSCVYQLHRTSLLLL